MAESPQYNYLKLKANDESQLMDCPACKNECSRSARTCPKCGHPFQSSAQPMNHQLRIIAAVVGAIVLVGLVGTYLVTTGMSRRKVVNNAVTELRKLDAATDVGVNKIDYSHLLTNAQAATKEVQASLPDGSEKTNISDAMQAYLDAGTLWDLSGTDTDVFVCEQLPDTTGKDAMSQRLSLIQCNPVGSELFKKYKLPLHGYMSEEPVDGKGRVIKKEALATIWNVAKEKLARIQ